VEVGLTPAQHQLLLAVRGRPGRDGPTIGEVADILLLRHHSAVELINRAEAAGLVRREPDRSDQRVVRLTLTALGGRRLRQLSERHLEELDRLRPQLSAMWHGID
jgi:DNA-binding MarR family transcriptional regulator